MWFSFVPGSFIAQNRDQALKCTFNCAQLSSVPIHSRFTHSTSLAYSLAALTLTYYIYFLCYSDGSSVLCVLVCDSGVSVCVAFRGPSVPAGRRDVLKTRVD